MVSLAAIGACFGRFASSATWKLVLLAIGALDATGAAGSLLIVSGAARAVVAPIRAMAAERTVRRSMRASGWLGGAWTCAPRFHRAPIETNQHTIPVRLALPAPSRFRTPGFPTGRRRQRWRC